MWNELCPEKQNLLSHPKIFQTGDNKYTYLRLNVNYKTPFRSSYLFTEILFYIYLIRWVNVSSPHRAGILMTVLSQLYQGMLTTGAEK